MDLDSMLRREDFFNIFFATVAEYYRETEGVDACLSFATDGERDANLVIYPRLSAAVSKRMTSKARDFFLSEWNIRGNTGKNLVAKCYVYLMTSSRGLLAQHRLCLKPDSLINNSLVIAPNNRSIRFFDYSAGTVGCMVKHGFTDKFFRQQLQFRLQHSYAFILPVKRYSEHWFTEQILHGHPLARITDEQLYQKAMMEAAADLGMLAGDTVYYAKCIDYSTRLQNIILSGIKEARTRKHIRTADALKAIVRMLAEPLSSSELSIPLVTSHGDLQSGNIWVEDSGKVWVYDWETVGERSVWYDAATLLLSTRRAGGIERMWRELNTSLVIDSILINDSRKVYTKTELAAMIRLVLLEDIIFYLEDMLELPEDWGASIFDRYILRLADLFGQC